MSAANELRLASEIANLAQNRHLWMERHFTIRTKLKKLTKLHPNIVQRKLYAAEVEQRQRLGFVRQFILKARQGGVTTYEQGANLHHIWSTPNSDALTVADKQARTDDIFEITQRALQKFTPGMLPAMGGKRAKEVSFPGLDSTFRTDTAGGNPGMGLTIGRAHLSEFAHFEEPVNVLSIVDGAVVRGGDIILETTGSVYESEPHVFWQEAMAGGNDYNPLFFPWWECDPETYRLPLMDPDELGQLDEEEQLLIDSYGLDLEQIKWRRHKIGNAGGRSLFMREYAEDSETCWMAAGDLWYDADTLRTMLHRMKQLSPPREERGLFIYRDIPPAGDKYMIIGGDTSEGTGRDRFTWSARMWPSWTLMSHFEDKRCTPEDYADRLYTYAKQHRFPILVIEKNFHGITVLRRLRDVHNYPPRRLYHRTSTGKDHNKPTKEIGWLTTEGTKAMLLDFGGELLTMIKTTPHLRLPLSAISDALSLRRDENGRVKLTGRDVFVAETLCWAGREYPYLPLTSVIPASAITSPF